MIFLRLWDTNGGYADVEAAEESRVDAAVQQFLDSGGRIDAVLDLTMLHGAVYRILASSVQSWSVSTPESRLRSVEIEKALKEEDRDNRTAIGLPWEEAA